MKSKDPSKQRSSECWAHFRFSVVGPLLAAPPLRGELQGRLAELAAKAWRHPISGDWFRLGLSTIERWYYAARNEPKSPVDVLQRKIRKDQGTHPALNARQRELIHAQYHQHPNWSYQLHCDNLAALIKAEPDLGKAPSYPSVLRYTKTHGLIKRPRRGPSHSPGAVQAELRFESREIRSYESAFVNALWHLDFHHGSLRVLLPQGKYAYPLLLAVMDDRSRLCCHAQWYLAEGAEELVHGLCQALEKRGLPRALMHDNGSAMIAAETEQGLKRLGILQENTLPYSPYQNGKQETFWAQIEGRLLAMLEGVKDLTLTRLNEATIAWVEMEYHRRIHREVASTPLQCFLNQKDVGRPCPSSDQLRLAFTSESQRVQRRSDGTISLEGIRYEIPSRYGHMERVNLRHACWERGRIHLCDQATGKILCPIYPLDKKKNAQGKRAMKSKPSLTTEQVKPSGVAPLLENLIAQYAATGLPPAYLPKETNHQETTLHRPVLLVDEAQEMNPSVFSELRLLASADLDSRSILTTVLAGDNRLVNRLQSTDLLPIASRVRTRLRIDALPVDQLRQCLLHLLKNAGNPGLIATPLIQTLCEHAMGNARLLTNMAGELLAEAQRRELDGIDEKLFFEVFNPSPKPSKKR